MQFLAGLAPAGTGKQVEKAKAADRKRPAVAMTVEQGHVEDSDADVDENPTATPAAAAAVATAGKRTIKRRAHDVVVDDEEDAEDDGGASRSG